ncbi:hypothetical protein LI6934_10205 [Bacillus licheniformis LMG 6934]|nr:hypothetical protein LI6934_10205 [Bacillus licheniformis LMG 6934]
MNPCNAGFMPIKLLYEISLSSFFGSLNSAVLAIEKIGKRVHEFNSLKNKQIDCCQ